MTSRSVEHDPETGELTSLAKLDTPHFDSQRRVRPKHPPTAADLYAARVRSERLERRQKEIAAIRAVAPACEVEGDPPVVWRVPAEMGAEPTGVILSLPRDSGRGMPGSRLVLGVRSYDGTGPYGGEPRETVTAFVAFRDGTGHLRRTMGVAIHAAELRAVADALRRHADALNLETARRAEDQAPLLPGSSDPVSGSAARG